MKSFKELNEEISRADDAEIQAYGQKLFNKCKNRDISFRHGIHSKDRLNDKRNEAPVTKASIIRILKKGIPLICKGMDEYIDNKICLTDMKTNLNLPMTVQERSDGGIDINTNSAQNKKDYWYETDQIPIKFN